MLGGATPSKVRGAYVGRMALVDVQVGSYPAGGKQRAAAAVAESLREECRNMSLRIVCWIVIVRRKAANGS